jgi:peptide/nickel transport system substrate-binding protein
MYSRWLAVLSLALAAAMAATRPHYGGTLRVEIRELTESPDPPETGPGMADLAGAFAVSRWEAGRRAVYAADEHAPGGRPFLDAVDVGMGRSLREQAIDLELGKADLVEMGPGESRRQSANRRIWSSSPVRIVALVFGTRVTDSRIREALSLAVDRNAILNVLLQRQGVISGALLPEWLSGYAFVFPAAADIGRARALAGAAPSSARVFTLAASNATLRPIADRIALNARDAGLAVSVIGQADAADARLVEVRIISKDASAALAAVAAALGLPAPGRTDSPEALYNVESTMLEGFRVVPLFHLPDVYGVGPRVHGGPGISPLGEWRFENLWVESSRP